MKAKKKAQKQTTEIARGIDLRGMLFSKRHATIFSALNALGEGQVLRITNDHDPKPLYYQLKAEHAGEFEWQYEKRGPEDWIVRIKKIAKEKNRKAQIKELIKRLHSGADAEEIKKKGKRIFENISPTDLALIEQEIILEGTSREEMKKLCNVHLEIMKDGLEKTKIKPKAGHPVHTLMEEHKTILGFVEELGKTVKALEKAKGFESAKRELETLKHISKHLIEADKHYQREEEALFPALEQHGVSEPPEIMREEHVDLKARKKALFALAKQGKRLPFGQFVEKTKENAEFIISELPNHIYKEDNILYPVAVQVIPEKQWRKIKRKCDKIGYCCFSPAS